MAITVKLDTTTLNDLPMDIESFTERVEKDESIFGIVKKYPLDLTFVGDGYAYLLGKRRTDGFCTRVDVEITHTPNNNTAYATVVRGYLFISDIEIDHTRKTMRCSIEDNNFGAIIKQNSKVPVDVRAVETRNGETLVATTSFALTMYTTTTGVNLGTSRTAYDIKDAFEHLIKFLSDNELDFQSDYLDNLADEEKIALVRGLEIRQPAGANDQCVFSFEDIMTFLHKKYNLWFTIDTSGVTPVFRLEDEDYLFGSSAITMNHVKDVKETFDQDKLVSVVESGDDNAIKDVSASYSLPYIDVLSFVKEKYYLKGNCNIDSSLNLATDTFSYDSNLIQQTIANTTVDNDGYVFAVQYVGSTSVAHKGTYILSDPTLTPKLYNEQLLNMNVVKRFKLHNDVAIILSDGTNSNFRASKTTTTNPLANTNPVDFDDDSTPPNEDPGGNYNNATYRYVAPSNGLYSFESGILFTINTIDPTLPANPAVVTVTVLFDKFNSGGTLLQTVSPGAFVVTATGSYSYVRSATMYMNATDYVRVRITKTETNVATFAGTLDPDTYFKTVYVFNGGGSFQAAEPNDIPMINLSFSRGLSAQEWKTLTDQLINGITINTNGINNTLCWISGVERNIFTGKCEWELVTTLDEYNLWG